MRAHCLSGAAHDLDRQPHAIFIRTAPAVGAFVRVGHEELVQEITLRPHDLHAIIARLLCAPCGRHDVTDLFFDTVLIQFRRWKRGYRGFDCRGCDALGTIRIAARVQDLHRNFPARIVDARGDDAVVVDILLCRHHRRPRQNGPFQVGTDPASDHQGHVTARAGCIKLGDAVPVLRLFQTGVHGPHEDAVLERREAQIKGSQQVRVVGHRKSSKNSVCSSSHFPIKAVTLNAASQS